MKYTDLRTLTEDARSELKRVTIRLFKKDPNKSKISRQLGIRRMTIIEWVQQYEKTGKIRIKEKQKGRKKGEFRTLNPEQEKSIQKMIIEKTPDQLKFDAALWNIKAIQGLIYHDFRIKMPYRTVCSYLSRWGFTPQRPYKRAYEQQPVKVQAFLEITYPEIKARAKKEGGEIHWGDEAGISNVDHRPRGYAPKGKTPVLILSRANRERINMISTITNQGNLRFMIYQEKFTAQLFICFIKRLIKGNNKKIFLIVDNLRVHHAKLVKAFLADKTDKIELFYLPSYSPEHNPDEYLNGDLKAKMNEGKPALKKGEMKQKMLKNLRSLQKQTKRIAAYFRHPKIQFAA